MKNESDKIEINDPTNEASVSEPGQEIHNIKKHSSDKLWLVFVIVGIICFGGGVACIIIAALTQVAESQASVYPELTRGNQSADKVYSKLTGEALADASLIDAPVYCVQTPNGTDGARPQVGITQAGVVFEAIAEAGITRFAAIYQNPTSAVIGPIRSLRIYYLEWDTPFDCTIVHAGGSADALAAVSSGGYKDLSEDYAYMYRGTAGARLWNNLFTTSANLKRFSSDRGYNTSDIKGFARLTPEESEKTRIDSQVRKKLIITQPASGDTSQLEPKVSNVHLRLGGVASFNVDYTYDAAQNKYLRAYDSGAAHEVYRCPNEDLGEQNPETACELAQVAPSVVVAIKVPEKRAWDNYHEDITTTGLGEAYIFQNGDAIKGTWNKASKADQIKFFDDNGAEVKLVPGQTFITAVPDYGSIDF